jgi:hypothetical protein
MIERVEPMVDSHLQKTAENERETLRMTGMIEQAELMVDLPPTAA